MELAGYVIKTVVVEGRSVAQVAMAHDISRSWLYELLARYRQGGEEGLKPGSRRPRSSPSKVPAALEDEIVALRKSLAEEGLDAGAHTILLSPWKNRGRKRVLEPPGVLLGRPTLYVAEHPTDVRAGKGPDDLRGSVDGDAEFGEVC